jgi:hypothetical protein
MRTAALLMGTMLWAAPAFSDHHNVNFDHHADFTKLKTFAMREGKGDSYQPELNNGLVVKKIADAIRAQLISKGLKETFNGPDVLVDFSITGEDFNEQRGGPVTQSEGTLVIDLVKRESSALIWRSVYRDSESNAAKVAQNLPNDVKKSLSPYPPRQKGPIEPGPSTLTATPPAPVRMAPRAAAAAALEIVRAAFADTTFVGENVHPGLAISLGGLERAARAVSDDDGRSTAASTNRNVALFDAIKSSADYATSIASRNVETQENRAKSRALAARLRTLTGN